jgi:hypothetical protein
MDKHKCVRERDVGLPALGIISHRCVERVLRSGIDDDRWRRGNILGANYNGHSDDLEAIPAGEVTG